METKSVRRGMQLISKRALCIYLVVAAGGQKAIAQDAGQIQDIIVTAQKRGESIQKTPISVVAISADDVLSKGITSTSDLASAVPGVSVDNLAFASNPTIRGISQTNVTPGDESAVGVYIDGVYLTTPIAGLLAFNNIERVEVLKGPQGTLFGRNSAGGVINIITKTPSFTPSLDVSIGYGNYDTTQANLYGTAGLSSNIAVDLAIYWKNQDDGWGKNLVTGGDTFTGYEFAARSKLLAQLGDSTTLTIAADYSRRRNSVGISAQVPRGSLGADGVTTYPGFYNTTENFPSFIRFEQYGASVNLTHDMGWGSLVNIASYRHGQLRGHQDQDITPSPITNLTLSIPTKTVTEEFQILSPDDSSIKWIAGLYYLHSDSGFLPLGVVGIGVPPNFQIRADTTTESYSGFVQVTAPIPFLDATNLTMGLRYTRDRQDIAGGNFLNGAPLGPQANSSKTFPKLTYKIGLDHQFSSDILGYASYSRGFKSGLFNAASPRGPAINPTVVDAAEVGLKTEWLDHRLRLNMSAFSYWIKDVQLTAVSALGVSTLFNAAKERSRGFDIELVTEPVKDLTLTAGIAYTDAYYSSFPNAPLYTPKRNMAGNLIGGNCGNCFFDASGRPAVETPPWTANLGLQYLIRSDHGDFSISANYAYSDRKFWFADQRLVQPATSIVNASIGWTSPDDRWDVHVWGKNLLDEHIYAYMAESSLADKGSPAAPLTFGFSIGVHLN